MTATKRREAIRALARLARVLERSTGELSLAHYRVLASIATGNHRASRLASQLAVGKPAVSAAVESLCSRGLLAREAVDGDLRATTLQLTPAGARLLDGVETSVGARLDELVARTSDPARTLAVLSELGTALDEAAAERHAAKAAR